MSKYWKSDKIQKTYLDGQGTGFIALEPIKKGEKLIRFDGEIRSQPHIMTLQIGKEKHIGGPGAVNHSCNPNCHVDFHPPRLLSSRRIAEAEQITFNYLTTEWELAEPFKCRCGRESCFDLIKGFKYLSPDERQRLEHVAPFLQKLANSNE